MNLKRGTLLLECLISLFVVAYTLEMLYQTAFLYQNSREYEEEHFELSWEEAQP